MCLHRKHLFEKFNKDKCYSHISSQCFFRGNVDRFDFSSKNVGDIVGICLGHIPKDGKKVKAEAHWYVEEVAITEKELGNK